MIEDNQRQCWDNHLSSLEVQGKFAEIISLERENMTWIKLLHGGLPIGQQSFLLKAGSDTLPHPLNVQLTKTHDYTHPKWTSIKAGIHGGTIGS